MSMLVFQFVLPSPSPGLSWLLNGEESAHSIGDTGHHYRLVVVLSLHLYLWRCCSASLRVIFIDSCSVNGCNFGLPMEAAELRVLRLCHVATPLHMSVCFYVLLHVCTVFALMLNIFFQTVGNINKM